VSENYRKSYHHCRFLLGNEDLLTLGPWNIKKGPGATSPVWHWKKYMTGCVAVGLLAYKSTQNWHDSSFRSFTYSTGGSCSNNFHFSLCLAFPSSGGGRSTMTEAFKSVNLLRNLAQNVIAPVQLKANQLYFYLNDLLREIRNCPSENSLLVWSCQLSLLACSLAHQQVYRCLTWMDVFSMAGNYITDKRFRLLLQNAEHLVDYESELAKNEVEICIQFWKWLLAYKLEGDQGIFHCVVAIRNSGLLFHLCPIWWSI